jgi:hypothetical protein
VYITIQKYGVPKSKAKSQWIKISSKLRSLFKSATPKRRKGRVFMVG